MQPSSPIQISRGGTDSERVCHRPSGRRVEHDSSGSPHPSRDVFEFAIVAGFAEGRSGDEQLEVTFERAETRQKEIARVRCEMRRERA